MTKKYRMAEKTSSDGSSGASSPEKSEASAPVTEAKAPVAGAGVAAPPASGDKKKSAEPTVIRTDRVCPNCKVSMAIVVISITHDWCFDVYREDQWIQNSLVMVSTVPSSFFPSDSSAVSSGNTRSVMNVDMSLSKMYIPSYTHVTHTTPHDDYISWCQTIKNAFMYQMIVPINFSVVLYGIKCVILPLHLLRVDGCHLELLFERFEWKMTWILPYKQLFYAHSPVDLA